LDLPGLVAKRRIQCMGRMIGLIAPGVSCGYVIATGYDGIADNFSIRASVATSYCVWNSVLILVIAVRVRDFGIYLKRMAWCFRLIP
jgi:hypothetical protein